MWQKPKTDWKKGNVFSLDTDYARIKGNIEYLHSKATVLYPPIALYPMKNYAYNDYLFADFFSAIDDSTDNLLNGTYKRTNQQLSKAWIENGPVFSRDDLNRIESAALSMYSDLQSSEQNRPQLKFKLGGGIFATEI